MTKRCEDWIYKKGKNIAIKNVSEIVELPYSTVRRIFKRIANKKVEERNHDAVEVIGIDKFHVIAQANLALEKVRRIVQRQLNLLVCV